MNYNYDDILLKIKKIDNDFGKKLDLSYTYNHLSGKEKNNSVKKNDKKKSYYNNDVNFINNNNNNNENNIIFAKKKIRYNRKKNK